jgi:hypothetical protein
MAGRRSSAQYGPIDSSATAIEQDSAIVAGTAIAAVFALYIGWKWKAFRAT